MQDGLKIGVIGVGGFGQAHLRAYRELGKQAQVVAVCDIDADLAQRVAQEVGAEAYTDPHALLAEASVDAVDICTPHDQHAALTIAAAEHGKHVLVEKAMATSLAECRAMVDTADRAGVTLMVAQNQRYVPSYRGVRRLIQSGVLGPLRAARLDAMQNLPQALPAGHWFFDAERAGGGVVICIAVHRIDLLRFLLGDVRRVLHAVCHHTNPAFLHGSEDYACATLEWENGAIGQLFATYAGYRLPWSEQFMIFGDTGTVHAIPPIGTYSGPAMVAAQTVGTAGEGWAQQFGGFVPVEPDRSELPFEDSVANEIAHFLQCCRTGREPISSGRDNLGTMRVVFGIYEAARTGQAVELTDL
jgi:predicted dehydrogenase